MRTVLFHRQYPNKRIAVTSLRRLYLKNKVSRKKVRQEKYLPQHVKVQYEAKRKDCLENLGRAVGENRKLIFLDEVNFTKKSIQSRDWSTR
jgi:hypothetical protein